MLNILAYSQSLSPGYLFVTPFCFQDFGSFLLPLLYILFQIDYLSPPLLFGLVGIFHVPLPPGYFSAFSSCLDSCVWSGLSVFWWPVVPFYCGGFSQWVVLHVWLVKVSWLGKLVSVFWCVEMDFFSLECNGVSSSEFWNGSMGLVWLWAAHILTLRAIFLRCWRICLVCLALELIGSWVVVGFSVDMEVFRWSLNN